MTVPPARDETDSLPGHGFVVVPYSVPGHVHPMLPVLAELVRRGHRVRVLVRPRFAAVVARTGAEVLELPGAPDAYVPYRWSAPAVRRVVHARARRLLADRRCARVLAAALAEDRPAAVLVDAMPGWPYRVARRAGPPTAVLSTTLAPTAHAAAAVAPRLLRLPLLHRWRPMVRRCRTGPRRLVLANTIGPLQPVPASASGVHLVGPLLSDVSVFARCHDAHAGRLLLVSPGTVFARDRRFFVAVMAAFAHTPWTVLMATGHTDPAALPTPPPNVRLERHLPQRDLLAGADAFLTHAGMNSLQEALAAGVPMAVAPRSAEQRHLSGRLVALGVARRVAPGRDRPGDLRRTIEELAGDPAVRHAVAGWQRRLAGVDGAARAADLLERWATAGPGRHPRRLVPVDR